MRKLMRKRILVPVVAITALAVAGIAVAFFTASGTGSGTARVGTAGGVTITNVAFGGDLYPGGTTSVTFDISNGSADTAVQVGRVVQDSIGTVAGCEAADFSFADVDVNQSVPASSSISSGGTLSFRDSGINQDDCQGSDVTLNLRVDNSGL